MKLFPIHKMLSWDLLFYYTINFLFLTQIKNISASDVVLTDSFYALFVMILQIPINIIIAFLGKKKSLVIGNFLLVAHMLVIIFSRNIFDLILANFISAIGFGLKETVASAVLKESIPPSKYKNQIFSKLNSKGSTWINDTGAYCTGMLFGKHRLFERISPKKSWEGSIGGGVFSIIAAIVMAHYFPFMPISIWIGLALTVVIFGTLGDLTESLLKRTIGIKDSGNILPGHGGMLDRFDSTLMAVPAAVVYLYIISFIE